MKRILFKDYLIQISKEQIIYEYLVNNKSAKECCDFFNISMSIFMKLLKEYGIHKPKDLHTENIKKSKELHFGNPSYNNSEKRIQTNLRKYGVENQFQRSELFPQIKNIKIDRYGSVNNISKNLETRIINSGSLEESYKKQQETYQKTCLEKFGVKNSAQFDDIKNKIKNTVQKTFYEKYGILNYWENPEAIRSNGSKNSKPNLLFAKKLTQAGINFEREFLLDGKWFDFKIGNILIEINPSVTHNTLWSPYSQNGIPKNYHLDKSKIAKNNGYRCVHVFDWESFDNIIRLLKKRPTLGARNCTIQPISLSNAKNFLDEYHLQKSAVAKINLGLFYKETLVAVMTFGKPRYSKKYEYELIRFCSPIYNICGGGEKLFKYFIENYLPHSIISYCDISKFDGNIYNNLGFNLLKITPPNKHWYNIKTKEHITDNLLRQRGFDQLFNTNFGKGTDNEKLMIDHGFVSVYDSGQKVFIWTQNNV